MSGGIAGGSLGAVPGATGDIFGANAASEMVDTAQAIVKVDKKGRDDALQDI